MRAFAILLLLASLPNVTFAQKEKADTKTEKVSASGTISAVGPGYLHVVSQAGDQWQVALDPKAEVTVTGSAHPSFLRSGMLVRFSGKFNKKAESVQPLSSLTIFTPKPVAPRQGRGEDGEADVSDRTKGLFKIEEPKAEDKKTAKPPETFDISSAGAVVSARGGKVQVRAPEAAFKIALTDDATLALEVNDYRLAKAGDKIDLEGWGYIEDKTKVVANRVTIRLKDTLGEAKKKAEPKPTEKKE